MSKALQWYRVKGENPTLYECRRVDTDELIAWLVERPHYCDRGKWQANVGGIKDIDWQDGFPRYYMYLHNAFAEMDAFLKWRLFKLPPERLAAPVPVKDRAPGSEERKADNGSMFRPRSKDQPS